MTYDPKSYWEARGGPQYRYTIRTPEYHRHQLAENGFLEEVIQKTKPKSLLDFGCGAGEWLVLWRNAKVENLALYEISHSMMGVAQKLAEQLWGCEWRPEQCPVRFFVDDGDRKKLPYSDAEFDLVVACEVLAHILPTEIEGTLNELWRICKDDGHLAIVTASPFGQGAGHNFDHDYKALLAKGFEITHDEMPYPYRHILCRKVAA